MESTVDLALPTAMDTMQLLLTSPDASIEDVDVMRAFEADFNLFSHVMVLSKSIAQDTINRFSSLTDAFSRLKPRPPSSPTSAD